MKVLLAAAGILLICAHSVTPAALTLRKRENIDIPEDKQDDIVYGINKVRRQFAKTFKIGNMHKVTWDESLEKDVPHFNCGTTPPAQLQASIDKFEQEKTKESMYKMLDQVAAHTPLSCIHPLQTDIACIIKKCPGDLIVWNCICGPEGKFERGDEKEGDAGSECDGADDDGLCDDSGSSNVFTIGTIFNLVAFYLVAYLL